MTDSLEELEKQIASLKQEVQIYRNALFELEAEKATLAHSFLGASIKIRMLLQPKE